MVLGRPWFAVFLEEELRESLGVEVVRANSVTGRMLVCHDKALSSAEVDRLVRDAVTLAVRQVKTPARAPRSEPCATPARSRRRDHLTPSVVAAGSATVALVLVVGRSLRPSPQMGLGGVLLATVIIVRRAWRRSSRAQQASGVSPEPSQHPLLHIVGSHRRTFYLASGLSVLGQVLDIAPLLLIGWVLSVLINGENAVLASLGLASASTQLWLLAGVTALVCILAAAVSFFASMLWRNLAQSVQHEWRTAMYAHVQRVALRHLEGERTTRLTRVLTDDINQLGRFFATSADGLLQLVTSFFVLMLLFLSLAPSLAWVALLPVPIIAWLSFFYQERVVPSYTDSGERAALLTSQLTNNLEASATVKSFGTEAYEIDRIHRLSQAYRNSSRRIDTYATAYTQTVRMCATVSFAGFLLRGGLNVLAGKLQFDVFNLLIGLPMNVLWKIPGLGDAVDQYQQTVAALGRVLNLRYLPTESADNGQRLDVEQVTGELVLDQVTFAYPASPPVLRNLSLRMVAGKTTGIVGVTGSGKTTIAKLLLRLDDVASGRVLLDGHDIRDLRLHDLRAAISFVAQDAFLFDGTVQDNISYGSADADPQQVARAVRLAEADGFIQAMPAQYDTMVGERGATLSGGQKQRLSLARAIVKNAPILILDEATSAVDNETEAAIQHALTAFARGRTLIIIAHRLSTIRHADWIYVLGTGGVIVEEGTHDELLELDGVYASLWSLQIGEVSSRSNGSPTGNRQDNVDI